MRDGVGAPTRVPPPASGGVDRPAAIAAVHRLLVALGQDTADPQLRDTPRRVVDALEEMLRAKRIFNSFLTSFFGG